MQLVQGARFALMSEAQRMLVEGIAEILVGELDGSSHPELV
jgi:hypothetical protein